MTGRVSEEPLTVRWAGVACAAAVAATLIIPAPASSQDTEWNRYTLEGLEGVYVRAETNLGCEGAGVSAASHGPRPRRAAKVRYDRA